MAGLIRFLSYHNAVPLAVGILVLGAGGAFAASDPGAIYSAEQEVVSIDNTYIADKDLATYAPRALITAVTEDPDNYYVGYRFSTIDIKDSVWRDVDEERLITVAKASLGENDLGIYVTEQLNQLISHNMEYLREAQAQARRQVSQKTVATTYSGLVGKFLDGTTEELPGYTPQIIETPSSQGNDPQTASAAASSSADPVAAPEPAVPTSSQGGLTLQLMGNARARIAINTSYVDLGVFISDPATDNIADLDTYLDGVEVGSLNIDTSKVGTHTIRYAASDSKGNNAELTRTVEIYNPFAQSAPAQDTGSASTTATSTSP